MPLDTPTPATLGACSLARLRPRVLSYGHARPAHRGRFLQLAYLLGPYLEERRLGEVIISPADVMFGPRTMVEPDLFAIPLTPGPLPRTWEEVGRVLLTVEVLSPSTRSSDRGDKRELYQRKGVPEYWIMDVEARRVERWRPNDSLPETLTEKLAWQPDRFAEPLVIDLAVYFGRVLGEPSREA